MNGEEPKNDSRAATYQDEARRENKWQMIWSTCLFNPPFVLLPSWCKLRSAQVFISYVLGFFKIPNSPVRSDLTSFPYEAMIRAQVEREEAT